MRRGTSPAIVTAPSALALATLALIVPLPLATPVLFGCDPASDDDADAGPDGSAPPRVREAAPLPPSTPIACGSRTCETPAPSPLDPEPCCSDAGGCGVRTRLTGSRCLSEELPGQPSLECLPLELPGGPLLQGCCTPEGECGIFDRFGSQGCIPGRDLGHETASCEPGSGPPCRQLVEVLCDGAEDCSDGQVCCGRVGDGLYDAFGCFPDCSTVVDGRNGVWLPLCHLGQTCDNPMHRCTRSPALPAPLARCYASAADAGPSEAAAPGVACGTGHCAEGEKCCLRPPHAPYCTSLWTHCECAPLDDLDASTGRTSGSTSP